MHARATISKLALTLVLGACSFAVQAEQPRKPDYAGHFETVREIAEAAVTLKPYFSDIGLACRKVKPFEKALYDGIHEGTLPAWVDYTSCCPDLAQANAFGLSAALMKQLPATSNKIVQKVYDQVMQPHFATIEGGLRDVRHNTRPHCAKVIAFSLMIPKHLTAEK